MKRIIVLLLCLIMVIGLFAGCGGNKAFSVGYAKVKINPETGVPLAGFGDGNTRFSGPIMDDLYANCVAFQDAKGNKVLMFGVDLLNTRGSVFDNIRNQISKEHDIPYSNIMFFASHTHSAPELEEGIGPGVTQYIELITKQCVQAARDALATLSPAKMYATIARPENLNFVRQFVLDDGSYRGWRSWEIRKQMVGHVHKADNLMQLVKFTREEGNDVVLINWGAHYAGADDVNYNGVSSDYPGLLRQELEKAWGCDAVFFQGGGGNTTSNSPIEGEDIAEDYKIHAQMLAQYAIDAADSFKEIQTGNIQVLQDDLKLENMQGPLLYAISFGDFACVFAPFEVMDTNVVNVREASKFKYTFYASCANSGWGNRYIADLESYRYPTYESCGHGEANFNYATVPKGSAEIMEAQFIDMLDSIFIAAGNEVKEKDEGYITPEFVPVSDGVEYMNPNPGDFSQITEGTGGNGLYCLTLYKHSKQKKMLADSRETAELVLSKATTKLLFDERNVIVGIAE